MTLPGDLAALRPMVRHLLQATDMPQRLPADMPQRLPADMPQLPPAAPYRLATSSRPPPARNLCANNILVQRVGSQYIQAGDLLAGIDDMLERLLERNKMREKLPPGEYEKQRHMAVEELTAAINDLAQHSSEPNPGSHMEPQHRACCKTCCGSRSTQSWFMTTPVRTLPAEAWEHVSQELDKEFERSQFDTAHETRQGPVAARVGSVAPQHGQLVGT